MLWFNETGQTFADARKAYEKEIRKWEPIIEKTVDLFVRMNTMQAEIVSTVLFAEKELTRSGKNKPAETDVLSYVLEWKQKLRPPLDSEKVAHTIRNLAMLKWLNVQPSPNLPVAGKFIHVAEIIKMRRHSVGAKASNKR